VKLPFDLRALWERALALYNGYSQRDRRVILGILIVSGLSLVYIAIIEPIIDYRKEVGRQITQGQEELERSMRFVGAKDVLRAEREDLRKRLTQAKARLLPGGTATLGAAALQERANALASEKGIAVQSTQVMKEENVDPYRKVAVRLTLSGELKPLADLVSAVEYGQQLNVPFIEINRRGAVAGAKGPRTLSVTVEVSGFVQGGAASKPEGPEGEAAPTVEAQADGVVPGAEGTPPPGDGTAAPTDGTAPPPPGDAPVADSRAPPPSGATADAGAPSAGAPPPGAVASSPPGPQAPTTDAATPPTAAPPSGGAAVAVTSTTTPSAPTAATGSTVPTITLPPVAVPTTAPVTVPPPAAARPPAPARDEDGH
jgi:hypothetical protein